MELLIFVQPLAKANQNLLTIWLQTLTKAMTTASGWFAEGVRWSKGNEMRVLLIEDDSATAQSIVLMLKSESFIVDTADVGEEGVDLGKLYDYDIILLDLNLPDISGYEVLKTLRLSKVKTPVLILSGTAGIEDKVRGLGCGADDYMTKPFHKDELVARIHAIVRRSKGHAQSVIQIGDLVVNIDAKTVEVGGQRVHLTGKEYQMLELLSMRKGRRSPRKCSSIIFMAAWMSRNSRSLTYSSANCARNWILHRAVKATSKPFGAAVMCCVSRRIFAKARNCRRLDRKIDKTRPQCRVSV